MRDSLSLLDQVISFTNGNLTQKQVSDVLGLTERTLVYEVFNCLLNRTPKELVTYLEKLSTAGQNPHLFLEDIAKLLRHSLLLKANPEATDMIDLPDVSITQAIDVLRNSYQMRLNRFFFYSRLINPLSVFL